jgi:hypothetical protein
MALGTTEHFNTLCIKIRNNKPDAVVEALDNGFSIEPSFMI